jgi:hypothetical protein
MSNYQNAKIYKIVNDALPDLVYYGSTIQRLSVRMAGHRRDWKFKTNKPTSIKLNEVGTPIIVLVENYPCNTKEELHQRERWYIENHTCVNKCIPCRTPAEHYQDNKEKYKAYYIKNRNDPEKVKRKNERARERYNEKKEEIKAYSKTKVMCECGIESTKGHLHRHKKTKLHINRMKKIGK